MARLTPIEALYVALKERLGNPQDENIFSKYTHEKGRHVIVSDLSNLFWNM